MLDEVIARAKFKAERTGSVLVVSPVDFVRSPERPTYRGRRVTAAFRQLEPCVTVELLARAAEVQVPTVGGGDPVSFSLRNVPTDQLFDLVVEVSGAKPSAAKAPALEALPVPPKCVADATPLAELRLTGFVTGVATPYASVTDAQGHSFIVGRAQCLGTEGATVKAISTGRLLLRRGAEDAALEWDPS